MYFFATGKDAIVAGRAVLVAVRFRNVAGQLSAFFVAGIVMSMFELVAGQVSGFIEAGIIVLMFLFLANKCL